ncbi:NUDIX domain-containing protein [Uliginosibacterium paludis]|uniref:GDP-mannose pyrophosphatase n=1 Tax=Uliginosibacterium paludis TaxID=1615952 RepID=A0ABV2CL81_9RHOO
MSLVETAIQMRVVYQGELLTIRKDSVSLPDASKATREYVVHPGACVVIPQIRPGLYVFERQFRYPLRQVFIEFPAGKLDKQESALVCAQRELKEETGYSAENWLHLGVMHNCIGYSNEKIEIFLASDLRPGNQALDSGEFLELFEMSLDEAEDAVRKGLLTDAKTITCLFWLRMIEGRHEAKIGSLADQIGR